MKKTIEKRKSIDGRKKKESWEGEELEIQRKSGSLKLLPYETILAKSNHFTPVLCESVLSDRWSRYYRL